MSRLYILHAVVLVSVVVMPEMMAHANESYSTAGYSTNYRGTVGLNTIPTARMDEAGTARIGMSHTDPHNHGFLGMQIAKPLYVSLRQSMFVSSAGQKPEFVYPGLDFKLRLAQEGRYRPEITFGMDSALGHKRFSSEYVALSKRYYNFDFTAGIAWGRLGSAGHIANPFARLGGHFDKDRDYNDEDASAPSDWFTGKEIGLFGGIEYFTPIEGLSFKADIGADRSPAERRQFDFNTPAPWSIGFNYSPEPWFGFGVSALGTDKVMARLTFQDNFYKREIKSYKDNPAIASKNAGFFGKLWASVQRGGVGEPDMNIGKPVKEGHTLVSVLHLNDTQPSTKQIGDAARKVLSRADADIETITIVPVVKGARGKAVTFGRRDLAHLSQDKASPEEVWSDLSFSDDNRPVGRKKFTDKLAFNPELSFSLGEEETTHLYRTALVIERTKEWHNGFISGGGFRINLADNLHRLFKYKNVNLESIRGDADMFTHNRINVDRTYLGWIHTLTPNFHIATTAGYVEEMYAGIGAEALYRPFDSPFAIGLEGWGAFKRDPDSPLALGLRGDSTWTGHVNMFYDIPDTDITAYAKVGRFLGGDLGITAGAETQFENRMKIKGYVTATNSDDKDAFGSDRNVIAGLQLSVPLGALRFIPEGSEARARIGPIGRDDGQMIDKPVSLYDVTEPVSYRHLGRNWQEVHSPRPADDHR